MSTHHCLVRRLASGAVPSPERTAMTTIAESITLVTGGVDTHRDNHVAAVVDQAGRILGSQEFPTTAPGHRQMLRWMKNFGRIDKVGLEGTGSYGAGLARFLASQGVDLVEVDRPNRQNRRRLGKTDFVDAESAARSALNGTASGAPKSRDGNIEMVRVLRVARRSAMTERTRATNQLRAIVVAAPDELRHELRTLSAKTLIERASKFRVGTMSTPIDATKFSLREIARRHQHLAESIEALDEQIEGLVTATAPELMALKGVGAETAAHLLIAAGDNNQRFKSEACFARLCGAAPIEASSGLHSRHRLDRGGDRLANNALWRIVLVRMSVDPRTKAYVERRTAEGKSKREIIRCLKRYVAREVFRALPGPLLTQ